MWRGLQQPAWLSLCALFRLPWKRVPGEKGVPCSQAESPYSSGRGSSCGKLQVSGAQRASHSAGMANACHTGTLSPLRSAALEAARSRQLSHACRCVDFARRCKCSLVLPAANTPRNARMLRATERPHAVNDNVAGLPWKRAQTSPSGLGSPRRR